jgi:hypothetical protein
MDSPISDHYLTHLINPIILHMKRKTLLAIALGFCLSLTACKESTTEQKETSQTTPEDDVKRGEYLVEIMGCNDCHSPKRMGPNGPEIIPELMLSGYPADRPIAKFDEKKIKEGFAVFYPDLAAGAGPWGVTFAANITPDATGIGNWTEEQFKKALTQGRYKGSDSGRMLLPPMPWQNYRNLKDEDAHAMFVYLKSLKPVKNVVPAPITPDKM